MARRLRSIGRPKRLWPSVVISLVVGGGFFALPFYLASRGQHSSGGYQLTQADRPLKFNAPKRGAFVNSGSFDAGIDPEYVKAEEKMRKEMREMAEAKGAESSK
mmetsp:Transcript_15346/g.22526  ORF Transcript_15346/g.22526 Transcript_15346/m.22526 type:complete len:104 (-) Transcript_15346:397-708(-)